MNEFAPYLKINGCFIVRNVSPQIKTINIFTYPINYMRTRDLLRIPGVAESDIRASLLKGTLQHKIRARDIIIICSDIDLLQFNVNHRLFLRNAGVVNGLSIGESDLEILHREDVQLIGTTDNFNTVFTLPPPDTFFVQDVSHKIVVYVNGIKQFIGGDFFPTESGGAGTGFDAVIFAIPPRINDIITADYDISNV